MAHRSSCYGYSGGHGFHVLCRSKLVFVFFFQINDWFQWLSYKSILLGLSFRGNKTRRLKRPLTGKFSEIQGQTIGRVIEGGVGQIQHHNFRGWK